MNILTITTDYCHAMPPCLHRFKGSLQVGKGIRLLRQERRDFRNMATKTLWKWHAIAAIPHLLRLLFLDLGARAPKTSQLMTHSSSPKNPSPNPGPKFWFQTGTKASCTVLSHNQDSILWRKMIALHIYSSGFKENDPPIFAHRLHTLVEND